MLCSPPVARLELGRGQLWKNNGNGFGNDSTESIFCGSCGAIWEPLRKGLKFWGLFCEAFTE